MDKVKLLINLPLYIKRSIIYKLSGQLFTPKPRVVIFPVNDRCNARCIMCNRWRKEVKNEISAAKIREVFSSSLFSKVERANIHGGEPTLRKDLPEIFKIIHDSCPNLEQMWLSTNGLNPKRIGKRIEEIIRVLNFDKIKTVFISVSLDGSKATHEKIRGVKGGFDQAVETIQILKEFRRECPLEISISTVIQPLNLYEIDEIEKIADNLAVPIYFIPLMFDSFFNIEPSREIRFTERDLNVYREIIKQKCLKDCSTTSLYWYDFLKQMDGSKRSIPCAFDRYVISLYPTGEILPCSARDWIVYGNVYEKEVDDIWFSPKAKKIRGKMKREVCPTCSNMCQIEFSLEEEFFTYTTYYFWRHLFPFLYHH